MAKVCNTCQTIETADNWVLCNGKSHGGRCRKCSNAANCIAGRKYKQKPEIKAKHALTMRAYRSSEAGLLKTQEAVRKYTGTPAGREAVNAAARLWSRLNPAKSLARNMRRHAAKLSRTPKWLSPADHLQIASMYELAKILEACTGKRHHVDHIIPLRGKYVSGLHVPYNLQVVPATQNLSKGNRHMEAEYAEQ